VPDRHTRAMLVRFTPAEFQAVRERAQVCGLAMARYVRETALGAVPRARQHHATDEALRQLARIGNNLNQLAHVANAKDVLPTEARLELVLTELMAVARRVAGEDQTT
jgi:Bacterial mobilisation protein (MobC)